MELNENDVIKILRLLEESDFDELNLEIGDLKLNVKKTGGKGITQELETPPPGLVNSVTSEQQALLSKQDATIPLPTEVEMKKTELDSIVCFAEEEDLVPIKAPMLGTFYRAPQPGAPPFVEVGDYVNEDDTVCIIEVMKLMNAVKAGVQGRIVKICAENGKMVEYQQTLFLVKQEENKAECSTV